MTHRLAQTMPRCPACGLHVPLCLCDTVTPLPCATRILVVRHRAEGFKSSNSGRLLELALERASVHARGVRDQPLALPPLGERAALLFPTDAVPLDSLAPARRPLTLVVPDGNWRQAQRIGRREPALRDLPRVCLPEGPPSNYRLRRHPDPTRLSTFEATARALGILEGPSVEAALMEVFTRFVERTLYSRGELSAEEVTGGVPPRWSRWPPG